MSKKCTCAYCKCKLNKEDAFVKHAGKHNTFYCNVECYEKAIERKKKKDEYKKQQKFNKV